MKPGATTRSAASITVAAPSVTRPISAILPPVMATSARRAGAPVPSTSVPFFTTKSYAIESSYSARWRGAASALDLAGGDQGRRVVELVELHHLAVAKRPEVRLRGVDDTTGLAIPPGGRAPHGDALTLRDKLAGRVVDHLPVGEQALEVPLEILLGGDGGGEFRLRASGGKRKAPDVVGHEVEPGSDAATSALVPLPIRMLELRDVVRGRSHSCHLHGRPRRIQGPEPRERGRSYHTTRRWATRRHSTDLPRNLQAGCLSTQAFRAARDPRLFYYIHSRG